MSAKTKTTAPTTAAGLPPLQRQRLDLPNVIDFIKTFDDVEDYIEALESFDPHCAKKNCQIFFDEYRVFMNPC